MEAFVITIGRQFGSGGHLIGEKIAQALQVPFYDKELINIASKESGLGKEFFEKADEKGKHRFAALLGMRTNVNISGFSNNYLSNETLFKIQSDVIRELAVKESCVFVGRCADYILREQANCLNLFITANTDDRICRVSESEDLPKDKIKDLLEKTDKQRANYYNYYTNKNWGQAESYDLCINSSTLGLEKTVEFILELIRRRF